MRLSDNSVLCTGRQWESPHITFFYILDDTFQPDIPIARRLIVSTYMGFTNRYYLVARLPRP